VPSGAGIVMLAIDEDARSRDRPSAIIEVRLH
jgi:hypothetical protein